MTTRRTIKTYDNTAEWMAEKFDSQPPRTEDIELAFSFFGKKSPRVLEIGCGTGRDATEILKRTKKYLGIDISGAMVRIARRKNPRAKFLVADAERFNYPESDIIFSFASLLHSSKVAVKRILGRAYGRLSDGGVFFVSLKLGRYRRETKASEYGARTYYYYTPELIKKLASGYQAVYEDVQEFRGQRWFTLILKK